MLPSNQLPRLGPLRLPDDSPGAALVRRIGLAALLIAIVAVVLWFDRNGLRDNTQPERIPEFVDVFYFTVVSLTTVGYGDITPITNEARLVNAIILTPIRIFLWALFLGTAYELSILRLKIREERTMRELKERLRNHVIVCGYGSKGHAIVDELLAHGHEPEDIVVIDTNEMSCAAAAKRSLVVLRGDASEEVLLKAGRIDRASYVLVATDRDDAATLICLTVRSLNPGVRIVAAARQEENIKLLYGAGANLVIAPAVTGGRIMAAAVRQQAVPQFLEDMIMFGEGLSMTEREVTSAESGKFVSDLPDLDEILVIGLCRGDERFVFHQLAGMPLQVGDTLILLIDSRSTAKATS